jgi:hypothetical protein
VFTSKNSENAALVVVPVLVQVLAVELELELVQVVVVVVENCMGGPSTRCL